MSMGVLFLSGVSTSGPKGGGWVGGSQLSSFIFATKKKKLKQQQADVLEPARTHTPHALPERGHVTPERTWLTVSDLLEVGDMLYSSHGGGIQSRTLFYFDLRCHHSSDQPI